jgi:epoxyqueuosine reductase
MKGRELKEAIRVKSRELGIDLIGFAGAESLRPEAGRLRQWLDRGYHGTMGWIGRSEGKRGDPSFVLPGVKTIVSAGINYYTSSQHENRPGSGKISRYAWGDDYHDIVTGRLEELLAFIRGLDPAIRGKVYADTGPVMEKAWAQRAGLGWQGKHTNLISMEFGSWIFLGELLLTAELEPDTPETDHCGNCVLCIEACPTGAINGPYMLDATLCLSYLTIEHSGEFTPAVEGKLDGWLYGCDVCQDVCPWNSAARESVDKAFAPRPGNIQRELEDVLTMGGEEFSAVFKGSPIKRTKLTGLRRNAEALLRQANPDGRPAGTKKDDYGKQT